MSHFSSSSAASHGNMSEMGKLLLIAAKLYQRQLITQKEKVYLKALTLQHDPSLYAINLEDENFLHPLLAYIYKASLERNFTIYQTTFQAFPINTIKTISKNERREKGIIDNNDFVYGETEFGAFLVILKEVKQFLADMQTKSTLTTTTHTTHTHDNSSSSTSATSNSNSTSNSTSTSDSTSATSTSPLLSDKVFVDLGSGIGRAVIAAALTQNFKQCIGIEYLEHLHTIAQSVKEAYLNIWKEEEENYYSSSFLQSEADKIVLVHDDLTVYDWSVGDIIFTNSTCFGSELMQALSTLCLKLKPNSIIVTFTNALVGALEIEKQAEEADDDDDHDHDASAKSSSSHNNSHTTEQRDEAPFEILSKKKYNMSWGSATVFIHRRK